MGELFEGWVVDVHSLLIKTHDDYCMVSDIAPIKQLSRAKKNNTGVSVCQVSKQLVQGAMSVANEHT